MWFEGLAGLQGAPMREPRAGGVSEARLPSLMLSGALKDPQISLSAGRKFNVRDFQGSTVLQGGSLGLGVCPSPLVFG